MARKRKPKTYETYIRAALRRIWGWYGERRRARARCEVDGGKRSLCEECKGIFPRKETQVDHTVPVENPEGFDGWDAYIARLFCPADGLRVLCLGCHQKKSNAENARRRARRAKEGS